MQELKKRFAIFILAAIGLSGCMADNKEETPVMNRDTTVYDMDNTDVYNDNMDQEDTLWQDSIK